MAENKTNRGSGASAEVPTKRRQKGAVQRYDDAIKGTDKEKKELARTVGNNVLTFYKMGMDRVKTATELQDRIVDFFEACAETGQFPSVEKMCLAIGYDRRTVWDWEVERHCGLVQDSTLSVSDIVKRAKEFLASYDAEAAMSGKLNPVLYIFRSKNYYGLQDKQEITIEPKQPLGKTKTMEEIAASVPELLEMDAEE